ncbi:MAG TPA: PEPxxWA-CTERM sorting domain-containing protein [Sphingobium sp.]|nr:PEPxxWA-CTERM sorting domain-containing protein [Sphingobium sp.]
MKLTKLLPIAAVMGAAVVAAQPASATVYTFSVQYFKATASATQGNLTGGDFYSSQSVYDQATGNAANRYNTFTNMVQSQLSASGLPVLNTAAYGGTAPLYTGPTVREVTAAGELKWWTPDGSHILNDGTGLITTDASGMFHDTSFFPSQGGGNSNSQYFQTAIISGIFTLESLSSVTFTFGGDDDMFLFVDGELVGQAGGIHAYTLSNYTTKELGEGDHEFKLFYADRNKNQAEIHFGIQSDLIVVPAPVPEPATWGMMIAGLALVGFSMRRRKTMVSFA